MGGLWSRTQRLSTLTIKEKKMAETWPMDLSKVHYGMDIPNSVVSEALGVPADDENFHFAQLTFMRDLDEALQEMGMVATICIRDGHIRILTHEEAADYNRRRYLVHLGGLARTFEKNKHVDDKALSPRTVQFHRQTLYYQGRLLQAIVQERTRLEVESVERKGPTSLEMLDQLSLDRSGSSDEKDLS